MWVAVFYGLQFALGNVFSELCFCVIQPMHTAHISDECGQRTTSQIIWLLEDTTSSVFRTLKRTGPWVSSLKWGQWEETVQIAMQQQDSLFRSVPCRDQSISYPMAWSWRSYDIWEGERVSRLLCATFLSEDQVVHHQGFMLKTSKITIFMFIPLVSV